MNKKDTCYHISDNHGITLLVLLITIVVIAIIGSVAIYSVQEIIPTVKKAAIITNMELIQAKAKTIYEEMSFEYTEEELEENLPGNNCYTAGEYETMNILNEIGITDEEEIRKYYEWWENTLYENGLVEVAENTYGYYLVNYEEQEIIIIDGYRHTDGNTYYKLSDIKSLE